MISATSVIVGATATRLVGGGSIVAAAQSVRIRNSHATDALIIGHSSALTPTTGYAIPAGQTLDFGNLEPQDQIWAIRGAAADVTAQVLVK